MTETNIDIKSVNSGVLKHINVRSSKNCEKLHFCYRCFRFNKENCLFRFLLSSIEQDIVIRLGEKPHSFFYEIRMHPHRVPERQGFDRKYQYLTEIVFRLSAHKTKDTFDILNKKYRIRNGYGNWFTIYYENHNRNSNGGNNAQIYLFGQWMDDEKSCQNTIKQNGSYNDKALLMSKTVKPKQIEWIGFAGEEHGFTLSACDTQATAMESWLEWSQDFNDRHMQALAARENDGEIDRDYTHTHVSEMKRSITDSINSGGSSDSINTGKNINQNRNRSVSINMARKRDRARLSCVIGDCQKIFLIDRLNVTSNKSAYKKIIKSKLKGLNPIIRKVPSLSIASEYALEIKVSKLISIHTMREYFDDDVELKQLIGESLVIIRQTEYSALRMDYDIWDYLKENRVTLKHKSAPRLFEFITNVFEESCVDEKTETNAKPPTKWYQFKQMSKDKLIFERNLRKNQIGGNTQRDSIAIGVLHETGLNGKNQHLPVTFSFTEIREMNEELYSHFLKKIVEYGASNKTKLVSKYQWLIKLLRINAIWPYIDVKPMRDGTIEKLEPCNVSYAWRGGTTLLRSQYDLPMMMEKINSIGSSKTEFRRLIYFEVNINKIGANKQICIGTGLGVKYTFLTSSTQPGLREYTWGLSGTHGELLDSNHRQIPYGAAFHDELTVGCGFLLTTPEMCDDLLEDGLESVYDKYTSSIFFTYNGAPMKLYPNSDANETLIGRNILHEMIALVSTGSENCNLTFNFGPNFMYEFVNTMIASSIFKNKNKNKNKSKDKSKDKSNYQDKRKNKSKDKNKEKTLEKNGDNDSTLEQKLLKENMIEIPLRQRDDELHWSKLLHDNEEEIISRLIIDCNVNNVYSNTGNNEMNRNVYHAIYTASYNRAVMSYYFYIKNLTDMTKMELHQLLVEFDLLDLATKLIDANIDGQRFSNLIKYIEISIQELEEYESNHFLHTMMMNDNNHDLDSNTNSRDDELISKKKLINTWQNGTEKERELIESLVASMNELNVELHNGLVIPKNKHGLSNHNIPPALWNLVDSNDKKASKQVQTHLIKLHDLIVHQRRQNREINSLSVIKQEFLLDFISFYLDAENAMTLISTIIINWARGDSSLAVESFNAQYELDLLLSGFIRGSNNPISTALQFAQFLKESGHLYPEIGDKLIQLNINCQKMAIKVLNNIKSSRMAFIALECNAALDIALESNLEEFVACDRALYLRQALWTRSSNQMLPSADIENHFEYYSESELYTWFVSMFNDYWQILRLQKSIYFVINLVFGLNKHFDWFFSPIGKTQAEFIVYCLYCALLVYIVGYKENIFSDVYRSNFSSNEIIFWFCNFSFMFSEMKALYNGEFKRYKQDSINYVDFYLIIEYCLLFLVRIIGLFSLFGVKKCVDNCSDNWLNILSLIGYIFLIVTVTIRVSLMLVMFYNMGFLIRSLIRMMRDISVFLILALIWLFSFACALYITLDGSDYDYFDSDIELDSIGKVSRMLFYAIVGDFYWQDFTVNQESRIGVWRTYITHITFIGWIIVGLVVFLNFLIAIMNDRYTSIKNEVSKFVAFQRLKVARIKDRHPPTIPAPFESLLTIIKVLWFWLIEPCIWLTTGKILNEEYLICQFKHWKGYKREKKYYQEKTLKSSILRLPYFIKYSDQLQVDPTGKNRKRNKVDSGSFGQRFKLLNDVWEEMYNGTFNVDERKFKTFEFSNESDPYVWICTYCCCVNDGLSRRIRRQHKYNDINRYYRYNDFLAPEYGFMDDDLQFLDHINPHLCDNCFRVKNWTQRHLVIESIFSFYIYNFIAFCTFRLWFAILVVPILLFIIGIIFGVSKTIDLSKYLYLKLSNIINGSDVTESNNKNENKNQSGGSMSQESTIEAMMQTMQTKQTSISIKQLNKLGTKKKYEIDRNKLYDNHDFALQFSISLVPLSQKQSKSLKFLFNKVSIETGLNQQISIWKLNIFQIIHLLRNEKDWAFNTNDFVDSYLNSQLNKSGTLLTGRFEACQKYNTCLLMHKYEMEQDSSNHRLPQFQVQLLALRHALAAKWRNDLSWKKAALRQTRTNYQFGLSPVTKKMTTL